MRKKRVRGAFGVNSYHVMSRVVDRRGGDLQEGFAGQAGGEAQGAGGVGGLLMAEGYKSPLDGGQSGSGTYYYLYDFNGNVSQVLDADGELEARYEYDPFGNLVFEDAEEEGTNGRWYNPFLFSTKKADVVDAYQFFDGSQSARNGERLYYYGYRYYSPGMGRWINRDPIGDRAFYEDVISKIFNQSEKAAQAFSEEDLDDLEEKIIHSVYVFLKNNSLSSVDLLGLCEIHEKQKPVSCRNWQKRNLLFRKAGLGGSPATMQWDNPCSEGLVVKKITTESKPTPGSSNVSMSLQMTVETRFALRNNCSAGKAKASATIYCCCPDESEE